MSELAGFPFPCPSVPSVDDPLQRCLGLRSDRLCHRGRGSSLQAAKPQKDRPVDQPLANPQPGQEEHLTTERTENTEGMQGVDGAVRLDVASGPVGAGRLTISADKRRQRWLGLSERSPLTTARTMVLRAGRLSISVSFRPFRGQSSSTMALAPQSPSTKTIPTRRVRGGSEGPREVRPSSAAHNAVGLAGESPVVGIDCLPT